MTKKPDRSAEPHQRSSRHLTSRDSAERPFTDFGQFGYGMIDRRCMWQTRYWVDIGGVPHELSTMSPAYVTNVLGYLRGNANRWYLAELWWSALEALGFAHDDPPRARQAITQARALLATNPTEWMETCPLMRRLQQLHAQHTPDDNGPA